MATSLADAVPRVAPHLRGHVGSVLSTAEGVALGALFGVTLGSILSYQLQRHFRLQSARVTGRVDCHGAPVPDAGVVLVGEYGPGSNAVFSTTTGPDGTFGLDIAPGLFSVTVQPPDGPQVAPGIVQVDAGQIARVAWAGC